MAGRFSGPGQPYARLVRLSGGRPKWTGRVATVEKHILDPIRWRTPRRVFVNSTSDFFHDYLDDEVRDEMMAVMALAPKHQFQVLTKRHLKMHSYMTDPAMPDRVLDKIDSFRRAYEFMAKLKALDSTAPLPNLWLGVSIESQDFMERAAALAETPAAVRFVSAEPLLGPLNFSQPTRWGLGARDIYPLDWLDWIIVGGESGPGFRPMEIRWALEIARQIDTMNGIRGDLADEKPIAFFFKQIAASRPGELAGVPTDLLRQEFPG